MEFTSIKLIICCCLLQLAWGSEQMLESSQKSMELMEKVDDQQITNSTKQIENEEQLPETTTARAEVNETTTAVVEDITSQQPLMENTTTLKPLELKLPSTIFPLKEEGANDLTTIKPLELELTSTIFPLKEESTTFKSEKTEDMPQMLEETSEVPVQELTTRITMRFEHYATQQMNFILDHILNGYYDFVAEILQDTEGYIPYRDKLKRYADIVDRLLHCDERDFENTYIASNSYNLTMKKLAFLQGKATKLMPKYLPEENVDLFQDHMEETAIWLDKTAEQMHLRYITYVTDEDDHVKHQYFNENFDDISRATEIQQKLRIIADLFKVATNRKHVTFMDLYMQS